MYKADSTTIWTELINKADMVIKGTEFFWKGEKLIEDNNIKGIIKQ